MFGFLKIFGSQKQEPQTSNEKVDVIFELVKEIRDELKPVGPSGERVSRLDLIMGAVSKMTPNERGAILQELESLEVDDQIIESIEAPKNIEEISKKINRSYGYTANRLRNLLKLGKAMRKRDAVTRKYVYLRV
ncbi:MAG: hypothetical protein GOV01_02575 [Candidatus Altiarchaeota archaeon]|nr:hypothetical protein [Candidatus Altiarchaeota archaeon]